MTDPVTDEELPPIAPVESIAKPIAKPPRPSTKPAGSKPGESPAAESAPVIKERRLDGEGRPYITLAQLMKREHIVESGGQAKHFVRSTAILVNGEAENRPGRKLHDDDVVEVEGQRLIVRVTQE